MKGKLKLMSKNFKYVETVNKKIEACGLFDLENMTINVDGEDMKITTLLKDFDGLEIKLGCGIKQETELELENLDEGTEE